MLAVVAATLLLAQFLRTAAWTRSSRATLIAVLFAALAWMLRGVTLTGALSGAALAYIYFTSGRWPLFGILLLTFALTTVATKIAHAHGPARGAAQVVANLLLPTSILVLLAPAWGRWPGAYVALVVAANAELAADTISSELGEAFAGKTYLFPTFEEVRAGENGGISLLGTLTGILAATAIALYASRTLPTLRGWRVSLCIAAAGVFGMFFDSFLGASLERYGWLSNNAVNLLGTGSSMIAAWILLIIIR